MDSIRNAVFTLGLLGLYGIIFSVLGVFLYLIVMIATGNLG